MRRFKGLAVVLSVAMAIPMAIVSFVPASAAPATSYDDEAQKCIDQKHVFVYAERDDGHVDTGCASKFSTGVEALKSAGFDIGSTDFGGDLGMFIDSINGYPENPDKFYAYWGYFHGQPAGRNAETKWEYSQLGASNYHPKPGSIEAWHYMLIDGPWEVPPTWKPKVDPAPTTPVASFEIPDKALQKCITDKLDTTTPSKDQLAGVTSLSCRNMGIKDLTGLDRLTGLGKAFLSGNKISNLKPLASSTGIFSLDVNSNEITDVAPLRSLTKLSRLDVGKNHIRDLSALKDIKGLGDADITSNFQAVDGDSATAGVQVPVPTAVDHHGTTFVADREVPEGVKIKGKNVTYPSAGDYVWQFRDASTYFNGSITVHVVAAPEPPKLVDIPDANFKSCLQDAVGAGKPLTAENLGALTEVKCIGKGIEDITGAEALTNVKTLYLTTNEIESVDPLAGLTKLETLYLPNNHVKDLAPLAGLGNLRTMSLDQNPITTVKPLSSLTSLTDLTINQNRRGKYKYPGMTSLDGLGALPKLARLVANNNVNLADLSGISGTTSLKKLFLNGDKVSDLTPIKGLTNLVEAGFDNNEISDVSALAGMKNLTKVGLSSNHISDLSPLSGLESIAFMGLRARWQTVTASAVPARQQVAVPMAKAADGSKAEFIAPEGVTVSGDKVTYPEASDGYRWTWSHKDATSHSEDFSGTLIQPVTAAVPAPTVTPTVTPTPTSTETPTVVPTAAPTETPTVSPTMTPTAVPTGTPTVDPAATPTQAPSTSPDKRGPHQGNIPVNPSFPDDPTRHPGLPSTGV